MAKGKKCTLVFISKFGIVKERINCSSMSEARRIGKSTPGFRWIIQDEDGYKILSKGWCLN